MFDAIADYVALPEFRGCPFVDAAAEAPAGEAHELAIKEYRRWVRDSFLALAEGAGVADSASLADALIVLYDGALATAEVASTARTAAMTRQAHRAAHHRRCKGFQPGLIQAVPHRLGSAAVREFVRATP
ncbi:MAG: hypothetical protein QOG75_6338 [Mycobacterium sp.]|nr:hypothetical protein [Mycobacterium sp.]